MTCHSNLVQQYPKSKHKRRKRTKHPPLFELGHCWGCLCEYGLERHHIYGGNPDRQHSDDYGLVVDLCHSRLVGKATVIGCHNKVTDELDQDLITRLQQEGQRRFEAVYGHDEFREVFGRNYL